MVVGPLGFEISPSSSAIAGVFSHAGGGGNGTGALFEETSGGMPAAIAAFFD